MWYRVTAARAQSHRTDDGRLCLPAGAKLLQLQNSHHHSHSNDIWYLDDSYAILVRP